MTDLQQVLDTSDQISADEDRGMRVQETETWSLAPLGSPCARSPREDLDLDGDGNTDRWWIRRGDGRTIQGVLDALVDQEDRSGVVCVEGAPDGSTFGRVDIENLAVHLEAIGDVTIEGDGSGSALTLYNASGSVVSGFTVVAEGSSASDCAGCNGMDVISSTATLEDLLIVGGQVPGGQGGGIYVSGGAPTFNDVEVWGGGIETEYYLLLDLMALDPKYQLQVLQAVAGRSVGTAQWSALHSQQINKAQTALSPAYTTRRTSVYRGQDNLGVLQDAVAQRAYPRADLFAMPKPWIAETCLVAQTSTYATSKAMSAHTATATTGGGIYVSSGSPTFTNLVVRDAGATDGAALYVSSGTTSISHGTLLEPDYAVSGLGPTVTVRSGATLKLDHTLVRGAVAGKVLSAAGTVTTTYSGFWSQDSSSNPVTSTLSGSYLEGEDPWWCTPATDELCLPSNAPDFYTDPDGDGEGDGDRDGELDYVGAAPPCGR